MKIPVVLACLALVAFGQSFDKTFTGTATTEEYITVFVGDYQVLRDGITVSLVSNPNTCFVACYNDLAPAYNDVNHWQTGTSCKIVFSGDGLPSVYYPRFGSQFVTLHKTTTGTCTYTINVQGFECGNQLFGPDCAAETPEPSTAIKLNNGDNFTFSGSFDKEFGVNTADHTVVFSAIGGNITVYARAYDYPRFSPDVYDYQMTRAGSFVFVYPIPPRFYYTQLLQIPIFYTVVAENDNVTVLVSSQGNRPCEFPTAGANCTKDLRLLVGKETFNISQNFAIDGGLLLDTNAIFQKNYSVGIHILQGSARILLRAGNIPTADVYDVSFPVASSGTPDTQVLWYEIPVNVNTELAPWFITIEPIVSFPNGMQALIFSHSNCPSDCYDHGTCAYHRCSCSAGYNPPLCIGSDESLPTFPPDVPEPIAPSNNTKVFFIVWGLLCGFALIGLWFYLHRRRQQSGGSTNTTYQQF